MSTNENLFYSKSNRDKDYYLLTPELRNEYGKIVYKDNSIKLRSPKRLLGCIT